MVISDDAEFTAKIVSRWRAADRTPAFVMIGARAWSTARASECDLAIVGSLCEPAMSAALKALDENGKPVILVAEDRKQAIAMPQRYPCVRVTHATADLAEVVLLA